MNQQSINADLSKMRSFVLYRKNLLGLMMALIISPTFLIILLVFGILFIFKVPMEINGVIREYHELPYQEFFRVFLWVFGSITTCSVLFGILIFLQKPKPYLYYAQNLDLEDVLYVIEKKYQLYINGNQMIRYDPITNSVKESQNISEINQEKNRLLFWRNLDEREKCKISHGTKRAKIRYQDSLGRKTRVVSITFRYDEVGNIVSFYEIINSRTVGNQNIESVNKCYFKDVNRYQRLPLPKKMQELL